MNLYNPIELRKAMDDGLVATDALDTIVAEDLEKAKKEGSKYINPDKTFKGGFKGCVAYQQSKGLSKESATKLCAYIGRRAGKI